MDRTIRDRDAALAWQEHHEPRAPKVGDEAPDFDLADAGGEHAVRLSSFRGERPVALVFGSFT